MESGAKGCEVVVSGKLRGQRAKSMKFVDGLMIHSGEPTNEYVDCATRHVLLRQGKFGDLDTTDFLKLQNLIAGAID
jgi:small subunit ribosomal protein S3e